MNENKESCQVNLLEPFEIIRYIRDLINLSDLLENGFGAELLKFIKQLKKEGWAKVRIDAFISAAGFYTRFERDLPRIYHESGSQREYEKGKSRRK